MGAVISEAFLLQAGAGHRFCILRAPRDASEVRGAVVLAPPFAEELNRCRRMIALGAERLAAAGFAVLACDGLGCGDSSGDFAEAGWDAWVDDVERACAWVTGRFAAPLWLWGVRAGALLAGAVLPRLGQPAGLLFWQPVVSGRQHLTQFLRIKVAAEMAIPAAERSNTQGLLARLVAGESLEVAGYLLTADVASPLAAASLDFQPERARSIVCFDVGDAPSEVLSPATSRYVGIWSSASVPVVAATIQGPPFWQTIEITEAPALVDATVAALVGATT